MGLGQNSTEKKASTPQKLSVETLLSEDDTEIKTAISKRLSAIDSKECSNA